MEVECGGYVCVMPVFVSCNSCDLCGPPHGLFKVEREPFMLKASSGVVFPDGCSQHGGLGIVIEGPGFDGGVDVSYMLEFLHPAPKSGTRCQLRLGFLFGLECLLGRVGKLCHKK